MRIDFNTTIIMQFKDILNQINPWIGLLGALCMILPSLYIILDVPSSTTKEHFILISGLILFIFFLREIFDSIVNFSDIDDNL